MKAITTRYHGPTNTRGARISAFDSDGNRATVPFSYELSGEAAHFEAVKALCAKMGWDGTFVCGAIKRGYVFVWSGPRFASFTVPAVNGS